MGRLKSRRFDNKKHIFAAPDMATMPKSDLRDMVETAPPLSVRLVK
jgi:hypothetical protein